MSKEIIMAETAVEAPDQDAVDTVRGAEQFLAQARAQHDDVPPIDYDAAGPAGAEPGPPADAGGVTPEGPRGPESPEWIWSPEFRREGRKIARAILALEKLPYKDKYNAKNGQKLNDLYVEWKKWYAGKEDQSDKRKPFEESKAPPSAELGDAVYIAEELRAAAEYDEEAPLEQRPAGERDLLLDESGTPLPPLKDRKEDDGSVTEGLLTKYKRLRRERATDDQIDEVEGQLGRYFREAKRLGLLNAVDDSLGPIYKKLKENIVKKEVPTSTLWRTEVRRVQREISQMGKDFFEMELEVGVHSEEELIRLEGVWNVYTDVAIERFKALLSKEGGVRVGPTINGEYNFNIEEVTFSVDTGEEGLRRFLPKDTQLRDIVERDISTEGRILTPEEELLRSETEEVLKRLAGGNEDRFKQLVDNRDAAYKMLIMEREARYESNKEERQEALKNLAGDRDTYRRLAIDRELYWSPTYANYYEVYAVTEEQFQKAADTFTQWLRSGLTKSPNELFQRVSGFKDALTTAGARSKMSVDFMVGLRQELEGIIGVLGADHANEHYNPDYLRQFLDFVAADEGPARFVRLGRAYKGKISALLWRFDNDPELELFFATYGSRWQLFEERNVVELHGLREQIKDKLIEEMLGVDIKSYDPRDPARRIHVDYREANLDDLSRFQPEEDTQNLFEGFTLEDQDNYYADPGFKRRLQMVQTAKAIELQLKDGRRLGDLPYSNEDRVAYLRYKKGELKLTEYEERLVKAVAIRNFFYEGGKLEDLKKADKAGLGLYEMYMETKNAVDLAMEMYGVMGEKSRRRGGVYLVDRNPVAISYINFAKWEEHIADDRLTEEERKAKRLGNLLIELRTGKKKQEQLSVEDLEFYKKVSSNQFVDYIPNNKAEQLTQFAENWVKATYGGELDSEIQEKIGRERMSVEEYRRLEAELGNAGLSDARRSEIEGKLRPKGIPAAELKYRVDQARRMAMWAIKSNGHSAVLWDFTLLQNGKPVDPNTLGYHGFYQDNESGGKEKEFIAYGQNSSARDPVERYRYCVPVNPRILGYNKNGEEVILVFDADGRPFGLDYDKTGQAEIYNKPSGGQRIIFDNLNKTSRAVPMQLKTPIEQLDGSLKPGEIHVGFGIPRRLFSHPYFRWSGHPYPGYQEEQTGQFLNEEAFKSAEKNKTRETLPEDEKPYATQRLIVDPTLQRTGHFKSHESREDKIILSAVEESYMGHWRIRDELNQMFLPDGPDVESSRTAYIVQDDGGSIKQWENLVFEAARWPNMKIRRARSLTSVLPLHFASMSEIWGSGGALNTLRMLVYKEYKMVNLFALQKWVAQTKGAQDEYNALFGFVSEQEGKSKEGVGEKFTNDADRLDKFIAQLRDTFYKKGYYYRKAGAEDIDNEFMNAVRDSLNRFEITIQKGRILESDIRGERAPLWLEGIDIYERNPDGSIKTDVADQRIYNQDVDKNRESGSSRHNGTIWFWRGVRWLASGEHWEGQETYPGQAIFYDFMNQYTYESMRAVREKRPGAKLQTHWEWLLGKIVR